MISVNGYRITPTIFPDGTSQIWQLPSKIYRSKSPLIDWRFEEEREIIDILSLRRLLKANAILHVPYLPYARQDKVISNDKTFNLRVFLDILYLMDFIKITSVDVHSLVPSRWLYRFENILPKKFHNYVMNKFMPTAIVFPDIGALNRYKYLGSKNPLVFEKKRNQKTGQIESLSLKEKHHSNIKRNRFLIIDDICDGGATFIMAAKELRKEFGECAVGLAVTHGIFSKGKEVLEREGIQIFTTNSLPRNAGEFEV